MNDRITPKEACAGIVIMTEIVDVLDEYRPKIPRRLLPDNGILLDNIDEFRRDIRKRVRCACERMLPSL